MKEMAIIFCFVEPKSHSPHWSQILYEAKLPSTEIKGVYHYIQLSILFCNFILFVLLFVYMCVFACVVV